MGTGHLGQAGRIDAGGGARLTPIGEVTAGGGSVRWTSAGREVTVARGYEHFAGRPAASGAGA